MNRMFSALMGVLLLSCSKDEDANAQSFRSLSVDLGTHTIETYSIERNSKYLVVFESGLGDDHKVWKTKKTAETIGKNMDVVIYDRGGYGKSGIDNNPRNIERLEAELETVIRQYANGRKVILAAHSLGGLLIRDYAVKNPEMTAGLLFIDPSHEQYNQPTQEVEDIIYNAFRSSYGQNSGAAREARELREDFAYAGQLARLPDVPVVVLTSMKQDQANTTSDQTYGKKRQDWYNAHESLKEGVSDFTHVQTSASGHYIMKEEPGLVINNFNLLLSKLP
ncbi:MAG: alpha/beta hydrolase [Leadbetterella sp.]|nr:alpha/beta hydrolase [Leadbetterella sp.]